MKKTGIQKIILIYHSDFLSSQIVGRGIKKRIDARCIWTNDDKHAMRTAKTKSIDLLVIEADTSQGFNRNLVSLVREQEEMEVPVIALSKKITEEKSKTYQEMGVAALFEQPFNPVEVWNVSRDLIKSRAFQ